MKPVLSCFDVFYYPGGIEELPTPWPLSVQRVYAFSIEGAVAVAEYYGYDLQAVVPV